jgi:hypothetical protein
VVDLLVEGAGLEFHPGTVLSQTLNRILKRLLNLYHIIFLKIRPDIGGLVAHEHNCISSSNCQSAPKDEGLRNLGEGSFVC